MLPTMHLYAQQPSMVDEKKGTKCPQWEEEEMFKCILNTHKVHLEIHTEIQQYYLYAQQRSMADDKKGAKCPQWEEEGLAGLCPTSSEALSATPCIHPP